MNNRGPRSLAGKAAVAANPIKHGLTATAIVLPSESADEWKSFHEDVRARSDAEGAIEIALASRIAELLWRLRRVTRAEGQFVSVVQMRGDTLEHDRQVVASLEAPAADAPDAPTEHPRQLWARKLGMYAGAIIAGEAANDYQRTLPVLLPDDAQLDKIVKYEAHLSRLLNHALHELGALQDRRRGQSTPLARLDIN